MPNEDGQTGRSAAWGVLAALFGAGAFATWSMAVAPKATFPIWPTYLFAGVAALALYMCFSTIWGWWPTERSADSWADVSTEPSVADGDLGSDHTETTASSMTAGQRMGEVKHRRSNVHSDSERSDRTVSQCDPFDLGVHPALASDIEVSAESSAFLTPYFTRDHDLELRGLLDRVTAGGPSVFALLAGDSCTGKTRALYEALRVSVPGWPLLRPADADELLQLLEAGRFRPGIVLWLNETQRHLYGPAGKRAADLLRNTLMATDGAVAVGSLWSRPYLAELAASGNSPDVHAAARALLDSPRTRCIAVPDLVTENQRHELSALAITDIRLEAALAASGTDGDVIQHLTGGPELLLAYAKGDLFDPVEHALITAALDARRLGHQEPISAALLAAAADGYLSPRRRPGQIDWADSALRSLVTGTRPDGSSTSIRDALTALATVRLRSGEAEAGFEPDDYLDQSTRLAREECLGPDRLWEAFIKFISSESDLINLGSAAYDRGLYWYAANLWKLGFSANGNASVAFRLFEILLAVDPDGAGHAYDWIIERVSLDNNWYISWLLDVGYAADDAAIPVFAERAARHASLSDPYGVAELLATFDHNRTEEPFSILAVRAANNMPLNEIVGVATVLGVLDEAHASESFSTLAARAAICAPIDDPQEVAALLHELRDDGAGKAFFVLAARAASDAPLKDAEKVVVLLEQLRHEGAGEAFSALAARAASDAPLETPLDIAMPQRSGRDSRIDDKITELFTERGGDRVFVATDRGIVRPLSALHTAGACEAFSILAARAASESSLEDARSVAALLRVLGDGGAEDEVSELLARHPAHYVPLDDLSGIAALLSALHDAGAADAVSVLVERTSDARLDDLIGVARLLRALLYVEADGRFSALVERAASHAPLKDAFGVARLLRTLRHAGADEAVSALLDRQPAVSVALDDLSGVGRVAVADDPGGIAGLLKELRNAGAVEQVEALVARVTHQASADNPRDVAGLLDQLAAAGAIEAVTTLAARAASKVLLQDENGVKGLLNVLRYAGADEAFSTLSERAANGGLWSAVLRVDSNRAQRFKFGRQPDGAPSGPWSWRDLIR